MASRALSPAAGSVENFSDVAPGSRVSSAAAGGGTLRDGSAVLTGVLLALIGFYGGFFGAGMGFMLLAVLSASAGAGLGQVNGAREALEEALAQDPGNRVLSAFLGECYLEEGDLRRAAPEAARQGRRR